MTSTVLQSLLQLVPMFTVCLCSIPFTSAQAYVSPVIASSKINSIRVGLTGPFKLPDTNALIGGHPAGVGMLIALDEINNRSDILPRHRIVGYWNSTDSDAARTIAAGLHLFEKADVHGMIGSYLSADSELVGYLSTAIGVPQISYGSTSMSLQDRKQFPYFYRSIAVIGRKSYVSARVVQALGYTKIALLASISSADQTAMSTFASEAALLGITSLTKQTIPNVAAGKPCPDLSFQMQQIKESRSRIIGIFAIIEVGRCVFKLAKQYGLVGPGYLWVGKWSLVDPVLWQTENGTIMPEFNELAQSMLGVDMSIEFASPQFQRLNQSFFTRPRVPDFWTAAGKQPNLSGVLAYDTTYAMARAWHDAIENRNLNIDVDKLAALDSIQNLSFSGASGLFEFDRLHERLTKMDVVQVHGNALKVVGQFDTKGQFILNLNEISFVGGVKPPNMNPLIEALIPASILYAAVATSVIGCLICIALSVFVHVHKLVPIIKATSPFFSQIILLGCIFGFISVPFFVVDGRNAPQSVVENSCQTWLMMLSFGFVLIYGSLLVRSYRLNRIFNSDSLSRVLIPDREIFMVLVVIFIINAIIDGVWLAVDPLKLTEVPLVDSPDNIYSTWSCQSRNVTAFGAISAGFKVHILLVTCSLSYKIRHAPAQFNEAKQIGFASYQLAIFAVITGVIVHFVTNTFVAALVRLMCVTLGLFITIMILFGPDVAVVVADVSFGGSGSDGPTNRGGHAHRANSGSSSKRSGPAEGDSSHDGKLPASPVLSSFQSRPDPGHVNPEDTASFSLTAIELGSLSFAPPAKADSYEIRPEK